MRHIAAIFSATHITIRIKLIGGVIGGDTEIYSEFSVMAWPYFVRVTSGQWYAGQDREFDSGVTTVIGVKDVHR